MIRMMLRLNQQVHHRLAKAPAGLDEARHVEMRHIVKALHAKGSVSPRDNCEVVEVDEGRGYP